MEQEITNKELIRNYYYQLTELQKEFWFEGLDAKKFCVKHDAITKRIKELENDPTD